MTERLEAFIKRLASQRGRAVYGPEGNSLEELRDFQKDVDILEDLRQRGVIQFVGKPHRESRTGRAWEFDVDAKPSEYYVNTRSPIMGVML